eukprot:117431_1
MLGYHESDIDSMDPELLSQLPLQSDMEHMPDMLISSSNLDVDATENDDMIIKSRVSHVIHHDNKLDLRNVSDDTEDTDLDVAAKPLDVDGQNASSRAWYYKPSNWLKLNVIFFLLALLLLWNWMEMCEFASYIKCDIQSKHTKQCKPQTAFYWKHLMQYLEKADSKTVEGCDARTEDEKQCETEKEAQGGEHERKHSARMTGQGTRDIIFRWNSASNIDEGCRFKGENNKENIIKTTRIATNIDEYQKNRRVTLSNSHNLLWFATANQSFLDDAILTMKWPLLRVRTLYKELDLLPIPFGVKLWQMSGDIETDLMFEHLTRLVRVLAMDVWSRLMRLVLVFHVILMRLWIRIIARTISNTWMRI